MKTKPHVGILMGSDSDWPVMEQAARGEEVRFQGQYYDIHLQGWRRPQKQPRERVPIYVGAMREGMCRMAGDVADGLIPHHICTPRWMQEVMWPNVAAGLKRHLGNLRIHPMGETAHRRASRVHQRRDEVLDHTLAVHTHGSCPHDRDAGLTQHSDVTPREEKNGGIVDLGEQLRIGILTEDDQSCTTL